MNQQYLRTLLVGSALTALAACGGGGGGNGSGGGMPVQPPPMAPPPNSPPALGAVADQSVDEDGISAPIAITVSDAETATDDLEVSVSPADAILLPPQGIDLSGAGGARQLTLIPAIGQTGSTEVTVTVTDADGASAASRFVLTVNPLFRAEFATWMRQTVLARSELDPPLGALHDDGSPLSDPEDILRIRFSDASADDPSAYDDLLPAE